MKKPIKRLKTFETKTFFAVFGIAVGVMSVIVVGFLGLCGVKAVNAEMDSIGIKGIALCPEVGERNFTADDIAVIRSVSGVKDVSPVFAVVCLAADIKGRAVPVVAFGCKNTKSTVFSTSIKNGNDISDNDIENSSAVCIVSDKLSGLLAIDNSVKLSVDGKSADFIIKGTVSTDSELLNGSVGECIPPFVYVPYTSLQILTGDRGYSQIIITPQNSVYSENADISTVSAEVVGVLKSESSDRSVKMLDLDTQRLELSKLLSSGVDILKGIAGVSLGVASLLTATVMTVTVAEKRRETAIKGLVGASRLQIICEFMLMSLKLCVIGVTIGTALGILITYFVSCLLDIDFFVDADTIISADFSAILSGLVLSVLPVLRSMFSYPLENLKKI